jgi:hypothetical protein
VRQFGGKTQVADFLLAANIKTSGQLLYYATVPIIVQILCQARHIIKNPLASSSPAKDGHVREIVDSAVKSSNIWGLQSYPVEASSLKGALVYLFRQAFKADSLRRREWALRLLYCSDF